MKALGAQVSHSLLARKLERPSFRKAWEALHSPKGAAEFHGDQLYFWFKEKFPGHKDAMTRRECRAMFAFAIETASGSGK